MVSQQIQLLRLQQSYQSYDNVLLSVIFGFCWNPLALSLHISGSFSSGLCLLDCSDYHQKQATELGSNFYFLLWCCCLVFFFFFLPPLGPSMPHTLNSCGEMISGCQHSFLLKLALRPVAKDFSAKSVVETDQPLVSD